MAFEMRLDSLELTNFHQFKRYAVDFDERLTVLVGDNGTGKSSVLAAAGASLGGFLLYFGCTVHRLIQREDARVAQYEIDGIVDQQSQYPVTVMARGFAGERDGKSATEWSCALSSQDAKTSFDGSGELTKLAYACQQRVQAGDTDLVLPVIASYGTDRLWRREARGAGNRRHAFSRQDGYAACLNAQASADQMLSWFFKMTAQDVQRAQSMRQREQSPLYAAVRGAVATCFRSITGSPHVNVFYNLDTDDLAIEYQDGEGAVQQMPMGLLSDGYRATLSMVADIAYRMAVLNPQLGDDVLNTPGIVLVDEIDLHLHPLWQARILGDLRAIFPNVQFIVTTHAPVVVSSVRAKHVRILVGGDSAERLHDEVYGSDAGGVLVSVMDAPERPEGVQQKLDEFYRELDLRHFENARTLLSELEAEVGPNNTDVVGAWTSLSLEEADVSHATDR